MNTVDDGAKTAPILTVSELNRAVARTLEGAFPPMWISGEVSNFTQAASGHWYFSIKDAHASVRAVMFRGRARLVGFTPRSGEQCECRAVVTLYEPRGDYQLQVDFLRRAGQGSLHERFLRLKEALSAEGVFDAARKRVPVAMPRAVGVVTSLSAAALRDVLITLARRAPHVRVVVYPSPVQGTEAAPGLIQALQAAWRRAEVDTLLLVRGGGSLEDLWSFNDPELVRAVADSPIPVISGVGHETDVTLTDFAADVRAPTPTAAAELSCRSRQACLRQLLSAAQHLQARQQRLLERAAMRLDRAAAQLVSPLQRLQARQQRLQTLQHRMLRAMAPMLERRALRLRVAADGLVRGGPDLVVRRHALARMAPALLRAALQAVRHRQQQLEALDKTLQAFNPSGVLERGYAIVRDAQGRVVRDASEVDAGQVLDVQLARGEVSVSVRGSQHARGA